MFNPQDQVGYLIRPEPSNPLFTPVVGCLIAGSKCTYKNGVSLTSSVHPSSTDRFCVQATAVIPGSHLWAPDRAPKVEECAYAEMEPGSALFTLGCKFLQPESCIIAHLFSSQLHTMALAKISAK